MGQVEVQVSGWLYAGAVAAAIFYMVVWWRIFNKARRSGILLLWGLGLAIASPWLADIGPGSALVLLSVSFLVSLGITSTMVSIICRPGWWVLPVVLAYLPQFVITIRDLQGSVFGELPDSLVWFALACWGVAIVMGVPMWMIGMYDLGDAFGYPSVFGIGLMFLPFVLLPVLAFDDNHYGNWGRAQRDRRVRAAGIRYETATASGPHAAPRTPLPPLDWNNDDSTAEDPDVAEAGCHHDPGGILSASMHRPSR